jgi:hypothetical protein
VKEAKVVVISVSGLNNRIFNSGDVVNEQQFPRGNFDKLIQEGYLQFFRHDDVEVDTRKDIGEVEVNLQPVPEPKQQGEIERDAKIERLMAEQNWVELKKMGVDETPVTEDVKDEGGEDPIEDTTIIELKAALDKMKVKYSKNASKEELYNLFRNNKK